MRRRKARATTARCWGARHALTCGTPKATGFLPIGGAKCGGAKREEGQRLAGTTASKATRCSGRKPPDAQARINGEVEQALLRKATGYTYTQQDTYKLKTVEYSEAGKKIREAESVQVVEVEKYVPPEYSAIALWLKARMPEKWGDAAQEVPPEPVVIVDDIPAQCGRAAEGAGTAAECQSAQPEIAAAVNPANGKASGEKTADRAGTIGKQAARDVQ
ncbi:MAG: hypothetical protein RSD62_04465 [Ruthenibacterium sp.]